MSGELKLCKRCNIVKPTTDFHPSKKQTTQFYCKVCAIERNGVYQKNRLAKQRKIRLQAKQALIDAKVKHCPKCEQTLSIDKFHKGQHYCKYCKSKADKISRMNQSINENRDVFPHTYSKVCGKCHTNKSLDAFYPSSSSADGRQSYCKKCSKAFDKERQEIKRIQKSLQKQQYQNQSQFNSQGYFEALRGGSSSAGRPNAELLELTPERIEFLNIQRDEWRKVFAERFDDILILIQAYEAEPDNSVQLVTDFHNNIRPNWKLEHKTIKQLKNEYYEFLRNKHANQTIGGNDSRNENN